MASPSSTSWSSPKRGNVARFGDFLVDLNIIGEAIARGVVCNNCQDSGRFSKPVCSSNMFRQQPAVLRSPSISSLSSYRSRSPSTTFHRCDNNNTIICATPRQRARSCSNTSRGNFVNANATAAAYIRMINQPGVHRPRGFFTDAELAAQILPENSQREAKLVADERISLYYDQPGNKWVPNSKRPKHRSNSHRNAAPSTPKNMSPIWVPLCSVKCCRGEKCNLSPAISINSNYTFKDFLPPTRFVSRGG